ncbi:MAG: hypothetical protein B7Y70_03060 [Rhizobiales bacterium 35-68-8]|nr:MAG: hypothetical protein B7Y70_03060 [Rhizobiales bacterium 35-68-8]
MGGTFPHPPPPVPAPARLAKRGAQRQSRLRFPLWRRPVLPVTSLLAALAAIALIGLSLAVSLARVKAHVDIGTGDDARLLRHIRAQGNFVEYVPLALILCGLAEYRGAGPGWIWTLAVLIVIGRASHAAGLLAGVRPLRAGGMLATFAALLTGAAALLAG